MFALLIIADKCTGQLTFLLCLSQQCQQPMWHNTFSSVHVVSMWSMHGFPLTITVVYQNGPLIPNKGQPVRKGSTSTSDLSFVHLTDPQATPVSLYANSCFALDRKHGSTKVGTLRISVLVSQCTSFLCFRLLSKVKRLYLHLCCRMKDPSATSLCR